MPLLIFPLGNKASIPHFEVKQKYHVAEAGHKHLILTIEGMGRMYTGYTSLLFNLFSHKMTVAKNNVYCTKPSVFTNCLFLFVILYDFSFFYYKILFCRKIGPIICRLWQPLLRPLSTITILDHSTGNVSVVDVSSVRVNSYFAVSRTSLGRQLRYLWKWAQLIPSK